MKQILIACLILVATSIAVVLAAPVKPQQLRLIQAGCATFQVPLHMPQERYQGSTVTGRVILGSRQECDITYDQYLAIHWSDRQVPDKALLPTDAYTILWKKNVGETELTPGIRCTTRLFRLRAEKPCGKIITEELYVLELSVNGTRARFVVSGIPNPVMPREALRRIAGSVSISGQSS
jgi:hypothetical protein